MSRFADALRAAVEVDTREAPVSELVALNGGTSGSARALLGIPEGARLPAKGTPKRREYDATMRRVQRYTTTGAQRRAPSGTDLAKLRKRMGTAALGKRLDRLDKDGGRCRMKAEVSKTSPPPYDYQERWLPSYGYNYLPPAAMQAWTKAARRGHWEPAAARFLHEFSNTRDFQLPAVVADRPQEMRMPCAASICELVSLLTDNERAAYLATLERWEQ